MKNVYIQANDIIAITDTKKYAGNEHVTAYILFEDGVHGIPLIRYDNSVYLYPTDFVSHPLCRVFDDQQFKTYLRNPERMSSPGEIARSYGYSYYDDIDKRREAASFILNNHLMTKNNLVKYLFNIFYRVRDKDKRDQIKDEISYIRDLR